MSRTLSAGLTAHLATRSHTRCNMLLLELQDGTKIGITDHDTDLDFDIGIGGGSITYSSSTGVSMSNLVMQSGLETDNYEAEGPISDLFTLTALRGGRFNMAVAYRFEVNWNSLGDGPIRLPRGNACEVTIKGGKFVLQVLSDKHRLNSIVGTDITNQCRGDHALCCVNIAPETATTVTAVTSARKFTVAMTLTDNHIPGRLWFTSGALAGTKPVEIFGRVGNIVELFTDLAEAPTIGDALVVKEGCDRTREMCRDRFDNVIEFRGYPEVPGRKVLIPGVPGA